MKNYVIIVAGGKGLRMGGDLPKQFIPLNGKPVLMHTLEKFYRWNAEAQIILVLPEGQQDYWRMLCTEIGCHIPHRIVNGGETRYHSVVNALEALEDELPDPYDETIDDLPEEEKVCIGVHDGVRPFVSIDVIDTCFREGRKNGIAIPVVPPVDSLRILDEEGKSHQVDRSRCMCVQTPQVFWSEILQFAYHTPYAPDLTDDASVAEKGGFDINTIPGSRENIKITTAFDLLVARAFFEQAANEHP